MSNINISNYEYLYNFTNNQQKAEQLMPEKGELKVSMQQVVSDFANGKVAADALLHLLDQSGLTYSKSGSQIVFTLDGKRHQISLSSSQVVSGGTTSALTSKENLKITQVFQQFQSGVLNADEAIALLQEEEVYAVKDATGKTLTVNHMGTTKKVTVANVKADQLNKIINDFASGRMTIATAVQQLATLGLACGGATSSGKTSLSFTIGGKSYQILCNAQAAANGASGTDVTTYALSELAGYDKSLVDAFFEPIMKQGTEVLKYALKDGKTFGDFMQAAFESENPVRKVRMAAATVSAADGTASAGGAGGVGGASGTNGVSAADGTASAGGAGGVGSASGTNGVSAADGTASAGGAGGVGGASGTNGVSAADGTASAGGAGGVGGASGTNGVSAADGTASAGGAGGVGGTSGTNGVSAADGTASAGGAGGASSVMTYSATELKQYDSALVAQFFEPVNKNGNVVTSYKLKDGVSYSDFILKSIEDYAVDAGIDGEGINLTGEYYNRADLSKASEAVEVVKQQALNELATSVKPKLKAEFDAEIKPILMDRFGYTTSMIQQLFETVYANAKDNINWNSLMTTGYSGWFNQNGWAKLDKSTLVDSLVSSFNEDITGYFKELIKNAELRGYDDFGVGSNKKSEKIEFIEKILADVKNGTKTQEEAQKWLMREYDLTYFEALQECCKSLYDTRLSIDAFNLDGINTPFMEDYDEDFSFPIENVFYNDHLNVVNTKFVYSSSEIQKGGRAEQDFKNYIISNNVKQLLLDNIRSNTSFSLVGINVESLLNTAYNKVMNEKMFDCLNFRDCNGNKELQLGSSIYSFIENVSNAMNPTINEYEDSFRDMDITWQEKKELDTTLEFDMSEVDVSNWQKELKNQGAQVGDIVKCYDSTYKITGISDRYREFVLVECAKNIKVLENGSCLIDLSGGYTMSDLQEELFYIAKANIGDYVIDKGKTYKIVGIEEGKFKLKEVSSIEEDMNTGSIQSGFFKELVDNANKTQEKFNSILPALMENLKNSTMVFNEDNLVYAYCSFMNKGSGELSIEDSVLLGYLSGTLVTIFSGSEDEKVQNDFLNRSKNKTFKELFANVAQGKDTNAQIQLMKLGYNNNPGSTFFAGTIDVAQTVAGILGTLPGGYLAAVAISTSLNVLEMLQGADWNLKNINLEMVIDTVICSAIDAIPGPKGLVKKIIAESAKCLVNQIIANFGKKEEETNTSGKQNTTTNSGTGGSSGPSGSSGSIGSSNTGNPGSNSGVEDVAGAIKISYGGIDFTCRLINGEWQIAGTCPQGMSYEEYFGYSDYVYGLVSRLG